MSSILALVICFMFLGIVLILSLIASRLHWGLKSGLIVMLLSVTFMFYQSYTATRGYPVVAAPPAHFRYLYSLVQEPDDRSAGLIYVWLIDQSSDIRPRVIELPYSKSLRDQMAEAKQKARNGQAVYMERGASGTEAEGEKQRGTGTVSDSKRQHEGSAGSRTTPYNISGEVDLRFSAPPDTLPVK